MTEGQFTDRQRRLLRDLIELAARRAEAETSAERLYRESGAEIEAQHDEAVQSAKQRYETDTGAAKKQYRQTIKRIKLDSKSDYDSTERAYRAERDGLVEKADANEQEARKQWDESVWVTETVFEAGENQPEDLYRQTEKVIDGRREELRGMSDRARKLLKKYRLKPPAPTEAQVADEAPGDELPIQRLERHDQIARDHLIRLGQLRIPRFFGGMLLPFLFLLLPIGAGLITFWLNQWQVTRWLFVSALATMLGLAVFTLVLHLIAKRQSFATVRPLEAAIQVALLACADHLGAAAEERDRLKGELVVRRDRDIAAAQEKYEPIIEEITQRREHHLARIEGKYPKLLEEIIQRRNDDLEEAAQRHQQRLAEIKSRRDADLEHAEAQYAERRAEREHRHDDQWEALTAHWREGMERCDAWLEAIGAESTRLFPNWEDPLWEDWTPPTTFSPSIRFGELSVDRAGIPGGIPEDSRLATPGPTKFALPATLDFPNRCSFLLLTDGEGRSEAVQTLQTVMLRLLASLPPAKVRFTIIDPVGLGQNFAGFMHLADYEESFVASRIWTEQRHIEQRLTDLTEHMENVIQKYLRNEFETIAQYNEHAGEIAEPYRFLVISDFPTNFSETAAQRLASVVSSGARCGVHTLITVDRRQKMPQGLDLADLAQHSTTLECKDGRFFWKDDDFAELPLALERPPSEEFLTHKLHLIGEAAKDATRVEVPFTVVAPPQGKGWTSECSRELSVPLGRSGATKLQHLNIGTGTSQHVLMAGKTGSGKSTLMHVLITNLALWYSPDEVQFYLVDFKKGVEFKTYATHKLPHARAVAVESDREFGLSVLHRVDDELKRRGDRFRELGVQDLPGFRAARPDEPMPRTLLIIDEFQEMFVEDDKLGQDAALLMDRLVRQGRAFGIHVLLGSQTLGGAYTLARSTIGQMQVRIALQCSEADSYLIMSDDNSAARLLGRPGEAIYNDAGGRIEGNSPFQIVWLPDREREGHLKRIENLADRNRYERCEPQIVFEGNVPADIRSNHLLEEFLESPAWAAAAESVAPPEAWLGEAIAIKGPTAATMRRQSGSNLMIVGQRDESALAMTATALVSLGAQRRPGEGGARFYLLDGTPVDSPRAGFLQGVAGHLPHDVHEVKWREVEDVMTALGAELADRQARDATDAPPIYIFIFGLQRFRMLRMTDDFSFSMSDEDDKPAPEKIFGDLLRDGPPLGIHTIAWCDTATNLNRTLDRHGLREFEMRVLFQMSGADSTQLIDSPAAGKLGLRRALFYNEEQGVLEKFRPYALPDNEWLEEVRQHLVAKSGAADPAV